MTALVLYHDYSRQQVHDLFAPERPFTPQAGTWGLHGIIALPNRPGDFVFFVTFGQQQGHHVFEEGITEEGVLSWQSQPRQALNDRHIQQLIQHDESTNALYLFLRTRKHGPYTYLGRLKYLTHDTDVNIQCGFSGKSSTGLYPQRSASGWAYLATCSTEPGHSTRDRPPWDTV